MNNNQQHTQSPESKQLTPLPSISTTTPLHPYISYSLQLLELRSRQQTEVQRNTEQQRLQCEHQEHPHRVMDLPYGRHSIVQFENVLLELVFICFFLYFFLPHMYIWEAVGYIIDGGGNPNSWLKQIDIEKRKKENHTSQFNKTTTHFLRLKIWLVQTGKQIFESPLLKRPRRLVTDENGENKETKCVKWKNLKRPS